MQISDYIGTATASEFTGAVNSAAVAETVNQQVVTSPDSIVHSIAPEFRPSSDYPGIAVTSAEAETGVTKFTGAVNSAAASETVNQHVAPSPDSIVHPIAPEFRPSSDYLGIAVTSAEAGIGVTKFTAESPLKTAWDVAVWDKADEYGYSQLACLRKVCKEWYVQAGACMQQLTILSPQHNTLGIRPRDFQGAGFQDMSQAFSQNLTHIDLRGGIFPVGSKLCNFIEEASARCINLREIDLTSSDGTELLHAVAHTVKKRWE